MKLKKYEIDAVVSKIIDEISSRIKVPDFSKELKEKEKNHKHYCNLLLEQQELANKISTFIRENNLATVYRGVNGKYPEFNAEHAKKLMEQAHISSLLPNRSKIENEVIIADNKDLSSLVKEIVAKYVN
jgi:hypothetical protein